MKIRISGLFLRLIFLTAALLYFSGCAEQMKSVQSEPLLEPSGNGQIKSIQFSDDASTVEITTDRPIVYTYYMLDSPPRLIVDLAQITSGALVLPIDVNKGNIKKIDVAKHEFGGGVLSRIDIALTDKVDVAAALDSQNRMKLILKLQGVKAAGNVAQANGEKALTAPSGVETSTAVATQVAAAAATTAVAEAPAAPAIKEPVKEEKTPVLSTPATELIVPPVAVPDPAPVIAAPRTEPQIQAKAEPQSGTKALPAGSPRSLTAITMGAESIDIRISSPVESFKAFKLLEPDRLVVDIANTRNLIMSKLVDINKFNLGKARVGGTSEKLRIVFDAAGGSIPPYHVLKSDNGLLIVFGESALKAAVAKEQAPAEKAITAPPALSDAVPAATPPVAAAAAPEPAPPAPLAAVPVPAEIPAAVPVVVPAEVVATLPSSAPVSSSPSPKAMSVKKPLPSPASQGGTVDAIEFTQPDGFSLITFRTGGTCSSYGPVKTGKGAQLTFTLKGCRLPANLQRSILTTGFDSVIKEIAPYPVKVKKGFETRIAIKLKSFAPYLLKHEGTVWQLEFREPAKPAKITRPAKTLKPPPSHSAVLTPDSVAAPQPAGIEKEFAEPEVEPAKVKTDKTLEEVFSLDKASQGVAKPYKTYTGRKVSLEFSDADIRKIFQLIAEVSNQNFLVSDDVTGTISLKLVNVPWDQALEVILENKGLGMQKDGNIVQIRPKTKMKSLDDEAIEMRITEEKKMPLSTVVFDINFASLTDIQTQFANLKSKRPDASIASDTRTNKIIVVDIEPNIKKMRKLLESLDIPEKQVMIEARIVEASSNFARDIGVKWGFGYQDGSASVANINSVTGSMGGIVSGTLPTATTGGLAAGVSFGKLLSNIQLDMRLSAAATVGQVKIISTPRVLTVNNKAAKISQGQMIPYQNTSSTQGAVTEFIEAALSLEVTPHITADGSVNMKIKASNNSVGSGSPPPINKKEATTELVVKNGETTVIGGIYTDSETEGETGIPYLSDIPLIGWFFKSNAKNKVKNELLIFITPKIMN